MGFSRSVGGLSLGGTVSSSKKGAIAATLDWDKGSY